MKQRLILFSVLALGLSLKGQEKPAVVKERPSKEKKEAQSLPTKKLETKNPYEDLKYTIQPGVYKGEKEELTKGKQIAPHLIEGSFLIYDCQDGYFACVNQEAFQKCQVKQQEDREIRRSYYSCVPFKKFSRLETCFQQQKKQIEKPRGKSFCSLD